MLIIGLTGSIATGKSTVSRYLSSPPYSLPVIDADVLARQVVKPGTSGYDAIVKHFGPSTPDLLLSPSTNTPGGDTVSHSNRPLNRAALGRRVFGDSEERKRDRVVLNGIVHPAVRRAMAKAVLSAYLRGCWAVLLDIPLLFESGLDVFCGVVLVVGVRDPEVQMRRLRERDTGLTAEEASDRVGSQVDVRVKAKRVVKRGKGMGGIVWNDGEKEDLHKEISKAMADIMQASPGWWGKLLWACPPLAALSALLCFVRGWLARREWNRGETGVPKGKAKL